MKSEDNNQNSQTQQPLIAPSMPHWPPGETAGCPWFVWGAGKAIMNIQALLALGELPSMEELFCICYFLLLRAASLTPLLVNETPLAAQ